MKRLMLMDKIKLSELTVDTIIGIWEWEKRNPQKVVFDIEMSTDISQAAKSDSIKDALDYKAISTRIKQYALENHFELIETLADKVAELILNEFDVSWVKLTISKPHAIRDSKNVSLMIERSKG
jgi:dihydroneopterin aldolase